MKQKIPVFFHVRHKRDIIVMSCKTSCKILILHCALHDITLMSRNCCLTLRETSCKSMLFCDSFLIFPDLKIERHTVSPEYQVIYATQKCTTLTFHNIAQMLCLHHNNVVLVSCITLHFSTSFLPIVIKYILLKYCDFLPM